MITAVDTRREVPSASAVGGSELWAVDVRQYSFFYGARQVLKQVSLRVPRRRITAIMGPSGCGKSTLLRSINRMNDRIPGARWIGTILVDGVDVTAPGVDVTELRRRVGMVFQRPTPFPFSIFDNVAYGPRMHGLRGRGAVRERVEETLRLTPLWEAVKDRLHAPATTLSGGQQQMLCIARALAVRPEFLLLDEPTSQIDPTGAAQIEDLLVRLADQLTIVLVTHNIQQAARLSHYAAFILSGELVEWGPTDEVFHRPQDPRTQAYLAGRFG